MSSDANHLRQRAVVRGTEDGPERTRIFILSDTRILRDALSLALSQEGTVEVVGASDLSDAAAELANVAVDAVLLDVTAHRSLELARALRDMQPSTKIVALVVPDVEDVVIECARAGVAGFVGLAGSIADLVAAVRSAIRGDLACSPRTAGMLLRRVSAGSTLDELTRREREIIRLMTDGLSNKQIARALDIRLPTVKNHVHSILGKMGVQRRGEVGALVRRGFVAGSGNLGPPATRNGHRESTPRNIRPIRSDERLHGFKARWI